MKIVISGAPSSGKTTTINELKDRGYNVYYQASEETIITRKKLGEPLKKIYSNRQLLQDQIIHLQWLNERQNGRKDAFFDCGAIDTLVYCNFYNVEFKDRFKKMLTGYDKAFILDPLPNEDNGIRVETDKQREEIQWMTIKTYREYNIPTIRVKVMSAKDRVDYILDNL